MSELRSAADVQRLCDAAAPEGLLLEFKEKEDPSTPELSRVDKRSIAETITAFANADGGTLVFGVRTRSQQGVDVADEIRPISNVGICKNLVELVASTNVSPSPSQIGITAIETEKGSGVVVCTLPRSDLRPHMCTAQNVHRYLRRGFEGNALMTPTEVRDQTLAVREAVIKPVVTLSRAGSFSNMGDWVAIGFSMQFGIENVGTRACLNPFLRTRSNESARSHSGHFDQRLKMWKSDIAYGTLVHVDDSIDFFRLDFISRVTGQDLSREFRSPHPKPADAVRLYDGVDDLHSRTITDKTEIDGLVFDIVYGAENASVRTATYSFTREEIAARIITQFEDNIRQMLIADVSPWRSDVINALREYYRDRSTE
jgi:hypothetical protein